MHFPYPRVFATSLLVVLAQCDNSALAPEGSTIDISTGSTTIAADGGQTTISALVSEPGGILVSDGTRVIFIASGGEICASAPPGLSADCGWSSIVTTTTRGGIASATVRGQEAGSLTVEARSGTAKVSKTITVSSIAAPANAKVVLESEPDTITVGESAKIRAFISAADGTPVVNFTRVVFSATSGTLTRRIVLTQEGFAETTLVGTTAGETTISLASGPASGNVKVLVNPTQ
jgi:hypothetical protein